MLKDNYQLPIAPGILSSGITSPERLQFASGNLQIRVLWWEWKLGCWTQSLLHTFMHIYSQHTYSLFKCVCRPFTVTLVEVILWFRSIRMHSHTYTWAAPFGIFTKPLPLILFGKWFAQSNHQYYRCLNYIYMLVCIFLSVYKITLFLLYLPFILLRANRRHTISQPQLFSTTLTLLQCTILRDHLGQCLIFSYKCFAEMTEQEGWYSNSTT